MLRFYYSPGSSALAAHILLEEVGADYTAIRVSIPEAEHREPEFLSVNPKGRIPALETPQGVITENPAILEYIAATHPEAGCVPATVFEQAQARVLSAYLCATVHVAYAHQRRGDRWADDAASKRDMIRVVPRNLAASAEFLEEQLPLSPWAMGAAYSYCDPYLFLLHRWMAAADLSLRDYPKLQAHKQAMSVRPATQAALRMHGLS